MIDPRLHFIVVTGIVIKDNKFLIAKRSPEEAAFPGLWSVPGGKIDPQDYTTVSKDTGDSWYNVLEKALHREVKEEVGLEINNIRYLTSLAYMRSDDIPTLIISLYCDYRSGQINLSDEFVESAWVKKRELDQYQFVPGLKEEIEMVADIVQGKSVKPWQGKYDSSKDKSVRDGN